MLGRLGPRLAVVSRKPGCCFGSFIQGNEMKDAFRLYSGQSFFGGLRSQLNHFSMGFWSASKISADNHKPELIHYAPDCNPDDVIYGDEWFREAMRQEQGVV